MAFPWVETSTGPGGFCARLFICASWSPAGKGLTSWLSFMVSSVSLSLSHWYPGSGVVLDCIDSWSLQPYLLLWYVCLLYDGISQRLNQKWFYGEAGNRTCDPWFSRHSAYPLHHRGFSKFHRSRLTFDLSAKAAHIGVPSIFKTYILRDHWANWTQI